MTASKLIVALDFDNEKEALALVDLLDPQKCAVKIGSELYTRFGPQLVQHIIKKNYHVFLDLKFHDIPNTVAASCRAAADLGVWMFNVHALGGPAMLEAAKHAVSGYGADKPLLIAVTILTSMNQAQFQYIGFQGSIHHLATELAGLAKQYELDGVVCSAFEVGSIKKAYGSKFLAVTPGIRPKQSNQDDQSRILTPQDAIRSGSDYLVVGRPITQAEQPQVVVDEILTSISENHV